MNYQEHIDRMKQDLKAVNQYPKYLDSLTSRLEIARWNINHVCKDDLLEMANLLGSSESNYLEYLQEEDFDAWVMEYLVVVGQQPMALKEQYEEVLRYWKQVNRVNKPYLGGEITEDILKHLEATDYKP